ncbi:MAG: DUF5615 family PIN-like protein [Thermomicrobiales bacterium]
MALRYYLDEDMAYPLTIALRTIGFDAEAVKDHAAFRWSDAHQLSLAVDLERTVITHNSKDFRIMHETLALWSRRWDVIGATRHRGILVLPQLLVPELVPLIEDFASGWDDIDNRLFEWDRRRGWREPV